jgi:squalene-hopene/tetraprenyl-beta-curcumene cyclase
MRPALDETLNNLTRRLLDLRTPDGHWEGQLASSALSTATAVIALHLSGASGDAVSRGLDWLSKNQNADGGWGDTTLSLSNISTTALCWAVFTIAGREDDRAVAAAERWLSAKAGGFDPDHLAYAIAARYGADRTFSVPILTVLALAGKISWRRVLQLPFELAAFPQSWFRWLRLPVVSYALPALIAIGLVRHRHRPTRNLITRIARHFATDRTLRVLREIQPTTGGFLEATPLTSFVVMSLIAADERDNPVVREGVGFLLRSVRDDGSWPIDTNLATWVTTLSVNALVHSAVLSPDDRNRIADWLLAQQYREIHPYTGAPPGGWAWTDLAGGVPDADDTAGALVALKNLGAPAGAPIDAAVEWLRGLQNRDGGMPTFCRGWGKLPFDRSSPDLTAHAILAWSLWGSNTGLPRAIAYLKANQRKDGSWSPLWFGNQHVGTEENFTYGTARVLIALAALQNRKIAPLLRHGVAWLIAVQNNDGGWGGAKGSPSSIEETGLAVEALSVVVPRDTQAILRGVEWLIAATDSGRRTPPAPIGFYFAKLWYFEELYPLIFAIGGLARARAAMD